MHILCTYSAQIGQGFAPSFVHYSSRSKQATQKQKEHKGRGKARAAGFVRGAHRETELRKKLKPTQPANSSSVRPWKGGVPIYKVQFGGGANYLLASNTRTAPVHADRKATLYLIIYLIYIYI